MTDLLGRERYRIDRTLGVGAMGTVHLARDTILDRVVAIKVLADHLAADDDFRHRFLREGRLAARLCHPNIVQVFDAGEDEGCPFLVMEHIDGETLADRLAGGRPCTGAELVDLTAQLAAGLAEAHAAGIVHRDVKPHNVLVRSDGVAKLTDFGIARAVTERGLTEVGTVVGTAAYMAPEQAAGKEVGPAADVYALGTLVRELAAGPIPPALESVVDGALAPDPAARPSAEEIHRRLAALAEETVVLRPAPAGPAAPERAVAPAPAGPAPPKRAVAPPPAEAAEPMEATGPMELTGLMEAAGAAEAAPTELRPRRATELIPPSEPARARGQWRQFGAAIAAAVALVGFLWVTRPSGGPSEPTSTTGASVPAVPADPDPARMARHLADWLRDQAE